MATLQEVADRFDVTLDQVRKLKSGMSVVWDDLRYECLDYLSDYDSEADLVAEITLDAGRLEEYTSYRGIPKSEWEWLWDHNLNCIEVGKAVWEATY